MSVLFDRLPIVDYIILQREWYQWAGHSSTSNIILFWILFV